MSELLTSFEFTRHGHKFIARVYDDSDMGAPWESEDGHGPVSEWKHSDQKRPGERPLGNRDRGFQRFYDWQEATAIAKRDGWGLNPEALAKLTERKKALGLNNPPTPGEIAQEAVRLDYDRLDGWARDLWHWVGISVSPMQASRATLLDALESVLDSDTLESAHDAARLAINAADEYAPENYSNALWGIESDNPEYHSQVAQELADQIIAEMESN